MHVIRVDMEAILDMEYEVGDRIFYPRRGAGTVTGVEEMEFVEGFRHYYVIELPSEKLTVRVPSEMVDELGVRPVVPKRRIDRVLNTLGGEPTVLPDNYKERQSGVRDQLATGQALPIAEVIRDLFGHERRAHLTKVDRDLFTEGREFLAEELALVMGRELLEVHQLIDDALEAGLDGNGADPPRNDQTA
jgi:CarD family transcriptional regulator